jgi:hypothetical protein
MINWRRKTMKREYALVLLLVLLWVVITGDVAMVEVIVWPFLSFVATSAGLTIYDRKVPDERRDQ